MKVADFNMLKKLLPMTRSDVDTEALMAIRRANAIIERSNTSWENIFNRLVTLDVEAGPEEYRPPAAAGRAPTDHEAERRREYLAKLLDDAEEHARGTFLDFVSDLRDQFEAKGWLSPAQVNALEAARARRGQAFRR